MSELDAERVVAYRSENQIGTITFNRPPANAYDLVFHHQFNDAIEAADTDDAARVVIIRSDVERFFCAGADIKVFAANDTATNKQMVAAAQAALAKIEVSGKPFIACLEGHTLGGGLEIAMACDLRYAAEGNYKFGLPEVRLGLLPGNGGSQRLPRLVGAGRAYEILVTGETFGPEEAHRIGLVNRVFPADSIQADVRSIAESLAVGAPLAMAATKRVIHEGITMELPKALALESELVDLLYTTQDAAEGFQAAVGKRAPNFKGI